MKADVWTLWPEAPPVDSYQLGFTQLFYMIVFLFSRFDSCIDLQINTTAFFIVHFLIVFISVFVLLDSLWFSSAFRFLLVR